MRRGIVGLLCSDHAQPPHEIPDSPSSWPRRCSTTPCCGTWPQEHGDARRQTRSRRSPADGRLRDELLNETLFASLAMPALLSPSGSSTTTRFGRTAASATCRRPIIPSAAARHRNGAGRCARSGAPRPAPLRHRRCRVLMAFRLYPRLDENRGSGQTLTILRQRWRSPVAQACWR